MTRDIGEVFEYRGVKLQVVENTGCTRCYFKNDCHNQNRPDRNIIGLCGVTNTCDKISRIFTKLEEEKDMTLIPGKHYVKVNDGRLGVVMDCGIIFKEKSLHKRNIRKDLTSIWKVDDIIEIFEWDSSQNISFSFGNPETLKSIWIRQKLN